MEKQNETKFEDITGKPLRCSYECPDHGDVGDLNLLIRYEEINHVFCIKCFDEFLQGKKNKVNFLEKVMEMEESNA